METRGRIHSFESFGTLDGPGIRFIVFFQGCPLRCQYCHNPDTWDREGGREISVGEIIAQVESCRNFIRSGGVTLSGGEPLMQPRFALALLNACRERGFHTALDTAGSLPLSQSAPLLDAADLVLLDIKALDSNECRELTSLDNTNELATLDYCEKNGKPVWIRHVLVPGKTLSDEKLQKLADFLRPYKCIQRIELLPFHKMASFKWEKMGIADPLADTPEPSEEEVCRARKFFDGFQ